MVLRQIVLSDRSYHAITAGGLGWSETKSLWLVSTSTSEVVKQFKDHNTEIQFANFSDDGTKLLSRSKDGIVIVRNL